MMSRKDNDDANDDDDGVDADAFVGVGRADWSFG